MYSTGIATTLQSTRSNKHIRALVRRVKTGVLVAVPDAPDRLEAQARLKSQSGKGAMTYVQAPPCTGPGRTMQNDVFREALRRGVGIGRPNPGGSCGAAACSEVMTAAHSYSCNSGGQFGRRHNKVVFALKKKRD